MYEYFLKFWKNLGFSLPSSRFLSRRMVSLIPRDTGHIVELGAGYGPLTSVLVEAFPDARIDIFEIDPRAVSVLREKFQNLPNITIHEKSAVDIEILFPDTVDAVISTLPLGSISPAGVDHILRAIGSTLKKGAPYIQYQYALQNLRDVRRYFHVHHIRFEPRNLWPAFIYESVKK